MKYLNKYFDSLFKNSSFLNYLKQFFWYPCSISINQNFIFMDINFETIGNATLIVSENNQTILSTDPWFDSDSAYFGSWRLSHKFPK